MPDEVASLPPYAAKLYPSLRAAARPDLRPPQALFPTASNARTEQSSGSALVCCNAPSAEANASILVYINTTLLPLDAPHRLRYCRTSKMSHARSWHDACLIRFNSPIASFGFHFHRTRRDSCGRWLWRLVSLLGSGEMSSEYLLKATLKATLFWRRLIAHNAFKLLIAQRELSRLAIQAGL
jgi:hypothetical protein